MHLLASYKSRMKYEDLKKYVYFVLQIEIKKYQLEQCIKVSQEKAEKLCIPRYIPIPEKKKAGKLDIEGFGAILLLSFIIVAISATLLENFIDVSFQAVFLFTFLLCGLIYILIDHFDSKELDKINFEIEHKYNLEQIIETERLQKEFDEKEKLEQFIDRLSMLKDELNKILFDIYNLNIIHSSYRKIMSVATIYNLLDTKICSELEGKDGAYNMCNTETYRNQMLIKVDAILENVEIIRDINFALYELLKNTNRILESILLCNYMENIQLDKISEDVNIIKFFEEIEYIKNCKDSFIKEISDMLKKDNVK